MTVETRDYAVRTIQGDTLTPVSIFNALQGEHKVLLESNAKYEESGRYSFIAANPVAELKGGKSSSLFRMGGETTEQDIPVIEKLKNCLPVRSGAYPFAFFGGAIGYFAYETAFHFEKIGDIMNDVYQMPDVHVFFYDAFVVIDHLLQTVTIVAIDLFRTGKTRGELERMVDLMEEQLGKPQRQEIEEPSAISFSPTIEKGRFIEMVETAKEHIRKGDIFQVVLSQTFEADFSDNPFGLYRKLRANNPSPYMFYMEFGDYTILGTSPESLVKVRDGVVTTNPIAGTKPRGRTREEDATIAEALLRDEKEVAEHKMLVDLGRNDVGRVSKIGSVQVSRYMAIERYKYVMHIVSEVKGDLREDRHNLDVLAASLPAGTVSGAPKIRAMQIINALEQKKRGVYAGAIGYISTSGDMDLALAIRTMVVKDRKAYVQAGAGIVHDSIPESEYEETLNKARALLEVRR